MKRFLAGIALMFWMSSLFAASSSAHIIFAQSFLCPDGSWENSSTDCGTPMNCPAMVPYKCWDNSCRKTANDCPPAPK